ncbi:MAG: sigma-70 family RNA polymerase sigma factor [Planctomycetota bacterium]
MPSNPMPASPPPDDEVGPLFARFQRRRDPRAIAAVYDRIAPELLLIAAHLGHRETEAEDLVQATFLEAMEHADRYDAGRPFMPWIIGILIHQAKREQRRRRRRLDPQRLAEQHWTDPADAAERAEIAENVAAQLGGLPPNYRQVLTLRWVHGLSAVEIAHTLGCPPETVRTRLKRGADILRQSLPAGFAAAITTSATSLAAVRSVVMARAREMRRASGARLWPAALGAPRQPRVAAALGATGAALVGAWLWWSADAGSPPPAPVAAAPAPATAAAQAQRSAARARDHISRREPVTVATQPRGRLELTVQWSDGNPATDVLVSIVPERVANPWLTERWLRSSDAGMVDVGDLAPGGYLVTGDRGGATRCTVRPGVAAHGELTIPRGVHLIGRVVGRDGAAIAGAGIWISRGDALDEGCVVARSDAAGAFAVRSVAVGRGYSVVAPGHAAKPLRPIPGTPGETVHLDIDLSADRTRYRLGGTVVDQNDEAISGALVQVGRRLPEVALHGAKVGDDSTIPPMIARTDAAGRFDGPGLVVFGGKVDVWVRAPGFATWHDAVAVHRQQPTPDLTVVLHRGLRLSGQLVDEAGRAAPARVVVREAGQDHNLAPRWAESVCWSRRDGHFEIDGVPADRDLHLHAFGAAGQRASTVLRGRAGEDLQWSGTLTRPQTLEGIVRDHAGTGLAGLSVEATPDAGGIPVPTVTTDDRGRFRLDACEERPYTLVVRHPSSAWSAAVATGVTARPRDGVCEIVAATGHLPTAALHGRLQYEDGRAVAGGARLLLTSRVAGYGYIRADDRGAFRFGPLPPLDVAFSLLVETPEVWTEFFGPFSLQPGQELDLGTLVIRRPGAAIVHVRRPDGTPCASGTVSIVDEGGHTMDPVPIREGAAHFTHLAPGRWTAFLTGRTLTMMSVSVEVQADTTARTEITIEPGVEQVVEVQSAAAQDASRLRLRWCDPDGRPRCVEPWQDLTGDARLVRRRLPAGRHLLEVESPGGRQAAVRFRVDAPPATPVPVVVEL